MTRPMRPERLLPAERFGSARPDAAMRVDDGMPHPRGTSALYAGHPQGTAPRTQQSDPATMAPPASRPTDRGPAPQQAPPGAGQVPGRRPGGPGPSAPQQGPAQRAASPAGAGAAAPSAAPARPPVQQPPAPQPPAPQGQVQQGQTQQGQAGQAPAEPGADDEGSGSWVLVKACQAGDQQAFKELYERYQDVVFRYVLFRLGDRTLAEDLTQETFLRALRRIGSVSYQGRDIGAWFVTIARNLIFDHVKSSRYRLETTTADMVEHSPTTHGPEQQVIEGATNAELLRAIEKLNPDQQDCIRMRFLQGLSVAETAARMDRAEGAVKALQHRAVRRLAQLLPEGLR